MDEITYTPTYFKKSEIQNLDSHLIVMLDLAREYAQVPFLITSGFRTPEHNAEVGGVVNSAHLKGLAVDIATSEKSDRAMVVYGLLKAGFQRVKLYKGHIHADIDYSKKKPWVGIQSD